MGLEKITYAYHSQTFSFSPIFTGRVLVYNDEEYFIESSDNSILITYTENDELDQWSDLPNVISMMQQKFNHFLTLFDINHKLSHFF